ncbi:hypothetical protein V8E53_008807 [Lactarius tabidus]
MAQGLESVFMDDKKKSVGVSSSLRRPSLNPTKNITSSVGRYLPMWKPLRDFASLNKVGARCIVALRGVDATNHGRLL